MTPRDVTRIPPTEETVVRWRADGLIEIEQDGHQILFDHRFADCICAAIRIAADEWQESAATEAVYDRVARSGDA